MFLRVYTQIQWSSHPDHKVKCSVDNWVLFSFLHFVALGTKTKVAFRANLNFQKKSIKNGKQRGGTTYTEIEIWKKHIFKISFPCKKFSLY